MVTQQRHADVVRASRRAAPSFASRRRAGDRGFRILAALRRRTAVLEPVVNRW